jgi:ribulose 1,5-bisphosphate synthetase/thiazole synthase
MKCLSIGSIPIFHEAGRSIVTKPCGSNCIIANMETTPVVIVGAGPAGLVVGLSLAQNGIRVSRIVTDLLI